MAHLTVTRIPNTVVPLAVEGQNRVTAHLVKLVCMILRLTRIAVRTIAVLLIRTAIVLPVKLVLTEPVIFFAAAHTPQAIVLLEPVPMIQTVISILVSKIAAIRILPVIVQAEKPAII